MAKGSSNRGPHGSGRTPPGKDKSRFLQEQARQAARHTHARKFAAPAPIPETTTGGEINWGRVFLRYGTAAGLVAMSMYIIYRLTNPVSTSDSSSCSHPGPGMSDLEFRGTQVMLGQLIHAYNQTHPETSACLDQYVHAKSSVNDTAATDTSSLVSGRVRTALASPVSHADVRALDNCRQSADKSQPASGRLAEHIRFFSAHADSTESIMCPYNQLVRAIKESTCNIRDFSIKDMGDYWRFTVREDSTCDWSRVDYPSCFSPQSISSELSTLSPEESTTLKGTLIYAFNRLHAETACPYNGDLPKALHGGALRLFEEDFEERFTHLLSYAQQVQGRDDILLPSTLTRFADMLDECVPSKPGTGRETKSSIPLWGELLHWIQRQAAIASRDEVIGSSYPSRQSLMASYTVIEKGKKIQKEEPCIQSALFRLFFLDTPAYWKTAEFVRHGETESSAYRP
ncbi:hypothetical protein [Legionella sp. CNM-4043-24]|uniref:hypothetical protein n=1 Tax=Legionella sp. CNM-4043-24 TaxID=3421646 RepID=UPI00403AF843